MKRKSFGKLAVVALLAVLMLFGLCVCSKKAETPVETPKATTTTTTTTVTTTTTTTTTPKEEVKVETAQPVKEEVVVVETPVVEETVVEEAPVVEAVVVEEPAKVEEVPEYSTIFSYEGVTANIVVYKDHATISVPEGVSADDIKAIGELLLTAYPDAAAVTYTLDGSNLLLEYPETASDYLKAAVSVLTDDAKWLIDQLNSLDKKEETAVAETTVEEEVPLFSTIFSEDGITSNIVVYADKASLTIPEGVTAEDIAALASLLLEAYPEAAACTYEVKDGTLYLTYPEQTIDYVLSAVAVLLDEAKAYVASLVETVVDTVEEVVKAVGIEVEEDGTVVATYNYRDLASAKVVMGDDKTTITYPSEYIYKSDIEYVMSYLASEYADIAKNIYYDIPEEGTLVIYYPAGFIGNTYYKLETLAVANDEITEYIDYVLAEPAQAETVVVASVKEEEKKAEEPAPVVAPVETKTEAAPVVAPVAPAPVAVEEKASFIKGFSASLVAAPKFNLSNKKFVLGAGVRFEALLSDKASLGLNAQYDIFSNFLEVAAFGKYNVLSLKDGKLNAYVFGGAGVSIGCGTTKGVGALLLGGVGAEYALKSNLSLFGEVGAEWSIKKAGLQLGATLGAKVTF